MKAVQIKNLRVSDSQFVVVVQIEWRTSLCRRGLAKGLVYSANVVQFIKTVRVAIFIYEKWHFIQNILSIPFGIGAVGSDISHNDLDILM